MENGNYLLVKGCAGIGNRLFTLAAAIKYAKKTNRVMVVDWRDGVFAEPAKNAFDIFFRLEGVESQTPGQLLNMKEKMTFYPESLECSIDEHLYQNYRAAASKNLIKLPGTTRLNGRLSRLSEFWLYSKGDNFGKQVYSDTEAIKSLFSSQSVEYGHKLSPRLKQKVVLFADYWPGDVEREYFEKIKIHPFLQEKIQNTISQLGINEETIGVHIRNTDKKPGKELTSLIDLLKKEAVERSNIFLATDNLHIEKLFRDTFKEKLISLAKYYPENSENQNMHHAALKSGNYSRAEKLYEECITDIFLLAACGTFYYQGNSSFSKLALMFAPDSQRSINWLNAYAV
ncbi:MAG TPA: nodulation protein NodZ [Bacteroidia bacterium]|nr:nodulation protein NodZ [Bacteroidia bacterium]